MTITTTIKAGESPKTIPLPEGKSLTLSGAPGTVGVAYLLDLVLGGTNSKQSWAIGAGALTPIGAYAGTQKLLITCTAGSIIAEVQDAVLTTTSSGAAAAAITGTPGVGNTLNAKLPDGVVGTLQWTRTTKAIPPAKTMISGAVANAVNSLSYVQQAADVGLLIGVDASNQVSPSTYIEVPPLLLANATTPAPALAQMRAAIAAAKSGAKQRTIFSLFSDSSGVGAGVGDAGNLYSGAATKNLPAQLAVLLTASLGVPVEYNSIWGSYQTGFDADSRGTHTTYMVADTVAANKNVAGQMYTAPTGQVGQLNFAPTTAFDSADIWFVRTAGSVANVNILIDGATVATPAIAGTPQAMFKVTVNTVLGIHTIAVSKPDTSGGVFVMGIDCWNSTRPSISIHNWSATGRKISDISGINGVFNPIPFMRDNVTPDIIITDQTINTALTGSAGNLSSYRADLGLLLGPLSSVKIIGSGLPYDEGTNAPTTVGQTHAQVIAQARQYALDNSLIFADANARWVDFATANAKGWFYTDKLHGTQAGYADKAAFYNALLNL